VALAELVSVPVDVPEALGVPVVLEEPVPVSLEDPVPVPVVELVPVVLDEGVPVALDEPVAVSVLEPVPVSVDEMVPVAVLEAVPVTLDVAVRVALAVASPAGRQGNATPPAASATPVDWPWPFQPQHVAPPAADSAHVWPKPAVTATCPDADTPGGTAV
jgi:hypothetical protein